MKLKYSTIMRLTNLPEETLVAVLQQLPLRGSSLSAPYAPFFLINRSSLGTHGLADNPACALSSVRKLDELRSVTRSWHALYFARLRDRRRAERARRRASRRAGVVGGEDKEVANVKGKGKRKERHEKEYSMKIPVESDLNRVPRLRVGLKFRRRWY